MRPVPAHGVIDHGLAEGVGQVVVATDDMGDAHVVVIHHHRMQIGRRAVGAQDDHVVQLGVLDADLALHEVLHHRRPLARGLQADSRLRAGRRLGRVAVAPTAVVAGRAALGHRPLAHRHQLLRRLEGEVGAARGQQRLRHLRVPRLALALEHRGLIRGEAEPVEAADDLLHRRLGAALLIGVLDAEQVLPAVMAGEEEVEQRGAGAADVEIAGRGWGETGADGHAPAMGVGRADCKPRSAPLPIMSFM